MKSNGIPKFLHRVFGFLEILTVLASVLFIFLVLRGPGNGGMSLASDIARIGLTPEAGGLTFQASGQEVQVTQLQGILQWKDFAHSDPLNVLNPRLILPIMLAHLGYALAIFDLLRRLFRNVSRGESFTQRNIRLVHWVGMALIVFTFVSAAAESWYRGKLSASLDQQVISLQGAKMRFAPPPRNSEPLLSLRSGHYQFDLPWGGVLTGLLVLALGEVFRQGLVLKEENELTV